MSVLLSAKNNFDLSNGELSSSMSDALVDFGSAISSSQLLAAQRLLRVTSGSPSQSNINTCVTSIVTPNTMSSSSNLDRKSPIASPVNLNSYADRQSPLSTSPSSINHHSLLSSRKNAEPIDQPTPEDSSSSSSSHSPSASRSNSPSLSGAQHHALSDATNRPPPTQLVAMANELLDQLKTLSGCTSPNGLSSPLSLSQAAASLATVKAETPISTASSPIASSPCVTFNLCNGQMQMQSSSTCSKTGNTSSVPLSLGHHLSSAAASIIPGSLSNRRRTYLVSSNVTPGTAGMHCGEFLATLAEMRRSNQLLDCCLFCEQQQLRAHKLVLAACSPFFRSMFAGISGCNNSTVVIPDVPLLDLHILIRIAYGEFNGSFRLSDRRVISLWNSARRLQMRSICQFMLLNQIVSLVTPPSYGDDLTALTEQQFDLLQVAPAGALDDAAVELSADEDDAAAFEQLEQLDFHHCARSNNNSPLGQMDASVAVKSTTEHRASPDLDRQSPASNTSVNNTTTAAIESTSQSGSNTIENNAGSGDEYNVISAIAALRQAAAAAAQAAVTSNNNTSSSNNRRRFGSLDLSTSSRNDQPMDLACSSSSSASSATVKDLESDLSPGSNAQLLRQMQHSMAMAKSSQKSNLSLATSEALLSQMALNGGSLSPTARALLLATTGLDLQSSTFANSTGSNLAGATNNNSSTGNGSSQMSPVTDLMAAAQQQLFGQLTGLAGLGSPLSSLNALQPVKRGRGRPPRHTAQPRDMDDESFASKERLHSPPQPDLSEMTAPKRWRPNMETILALKSRNKLVANQMPLVNNSLHHNASAANSAMNGPNHKNQNAISSSVGPGGSVSGNTCNASLIGSTNGITLSSNVSAASGGLNLSGSGGGNPSSCLSAAKSLMGKLPNDRNGNGGPDNKNVCPFCPQVYYSNQAMNDHINNVHTKNSTKYVCDVCGKEFSWKISLVKHQKTHTAGGSDALSHNSISSNTCTSNNSTTGNSSIVDAIPAVPVSLSGNSSLFHHHHNQHQLNQQMSRELSKQFSQSSVGACNGLSAQHLLSNGDLFKNLMSQRDSIDLPAIKFD